MGDELYDIQTLHVDLNNSGLQAAGGVSGDAQSVWSCTFIFKLYLGSRSSISAGSSYRGKVFRAWLYRGRSHARWNLKSSFELTIRILPNIEASILSEGVQP